MLAQCSRAITWRCQKDYGRGICAKCTWNLIHDNVLFESHSVSLDSIRLDLERGAQVTSNISLIIHPPVVHLWEYLIRSDACFLACRWIFVPHWNRLKPCHCKLWRDWLRELTWLHTIVHLWLLSIWSSHSKANFIFIQWMGKTFPHSILFTRIIEIFDFFG